MYDRHRPGNRYLYDFQEWIHHSGAHHSHTSSYSDGRVGGRLLWLQKNPEERNLPDHPDMSFCRCRNRGLWIMKKDI